IRSHTGDGSTPHVSRLGAVGFPFTDSEHGVTTAHREQHSAHRSDHSNARSPRIEEVSFLFHEVQMQTMQAAMLASLTNVQKFLDTHAAKLGDVASGAARKRLDG